MLDKLLRVTSQTGLFLLRGAGWAAIGVLIGFVSSLLFRFSFKGTIDVFNLTEALLGTIITGLSIVGAFMIAWQWEKLENKMKDFDISVKSSQDWISTEMETFRKHKVTRFEEFEQRMNELERKAQKCHVIFGKTLAAVGDGGEEEIKS